MSRRVVVAAALAAVALGGVAPGLAATPAAPHATRPAVSVHPVRTLLHTVPKLVRSATDLGALDPLRTMHLVLPLALPDHRGLDRYVAAAYRPHSAHFHRFLSPTAFGERFGARP
ncbi:MAG TPA: hypothetical protein VHE56_04335, partial [Mycobacteriales bacterium]|nr:hypothetical protein [Mycobacteriales bacterium]